MRQAGPVRRQVPFCCHNCGLEVQREGNRILAVRPDKAHPRTLGYICRKCARIAHCQAHKERLTHPLKREGGGFVKTGRALLEHPEGILIGRMDPDRNLENPTIPDMPAPGTVMVPHGFGMLYNGEVYGANVNRLTRSAHRDRIAGTPIHRYVPCRVEPA